MKDNLKDHLKILMHKTAEGDQRAFRQLAETMGQRIFSMAYRLLNGNRYAAEEVVQDVLIKLWQMAPRWQPTGSVPAYISRITYTTCMDRHRDQRKWVEIPESLEAKDHLNENIIQLDQHKQLLESINKLPKRQQEAIFLTYFHENRHKEVATIMGTTEKAVEHLVARGLKTLATSLPASLKEGGFLK